MGEDDHDGRAVRAQLLKARKVWVRLGNILKDENVSPRVNGMFFRAMVQAVLLYRSETWYLTPALLARLNGFQIKAGYRMARENRLKRDPDGNWMYPRSEDVLEECGLLKMEAYILRRHNSIAEYVATRPLYHACREGEPLCGTPHRLWWWEQESSMDEESLA